MKASNVLPARTLWFLGTDMTTAEFKRARKALRMTRPQLAAALGLGKHGDRTILRIEQGANITGPMRLAMQKLLDDAGTIGRE